MTHTPIRRPEFAGHYRHRMSHDHRARLIERMLNVAEKIRKRTVDMHDKGSDGYAVSYLLLSGDWDLLQKLRERLKVDTEKKNLPTVG